jgi:hypothetical protein
LIGLITRGLSNGSSVVTRGIGAVSAGEVAPVVDTDRDYSTLVKRIDPRTIIRIYKVLARPLSFGGIDPTIIGRARAVSRREIPAVTSRANIKNLRLALVPNRAVNIPALKRPKIRGL